RHLDAGARAERGYQAVVRDVEDEPRRGAGGEGEGQRGGDGLVAARGDIRLVPLAGPLAGTQLGEVRAVPLLVSRRPQPRRTGRAGGRGGVELALPVADHLAPGLPGRLDVAHGLLPGVVPVEVLVRDGAQRPR